MVDIAPLMRIEGVVKAFPNGTLALKGVDLDIERGKVHGLLGANGAGKSTLIKILSGAYGATLGRILWKGNEVTWATPKAANEMGIATIHQHIPLVPTLSVMENVFLGDSSRGWRRGRQYERRFETICSTIGYDIDPNDLVGDLPIGKRQMVAILQAVGAGADLIVMDEPTASLAAEERELVYSTVRNLSAQQGKAVLFVSHFLDEVIALTDCVTVLRDGQAVLRADTKDLDEARIAEAIVGRQIVALEAGGLARAAAAARDTTPARPLLELSHLKSGEAKLAETNLTLHAGEVVGVAGLLGSGRSELLHAIFGSDPCASGGVVLDGVNVGRSPSAAVKSGLALVPEDRLRQGLVPDFEIWRNTTLPALDRVSWLKWMPVRSREVERGADAIRELKIKAQSPDILVSELSGGNAQKVTIAKWLYSDVKVFLLDEPTAGIDIGAKTDILFLVRKLAETGVGVIIVSSEFEELLAVSDRIIVMRDGQIVAERMVNETSEHELVLLAGGQTPEKQHVTPTRHVT
ncbi:sugar ABC transporter ATP-binding protein [Devosia sp. CN2-171]|uniref:sugar ABC transporter ATP-binding protein n=1 Tax=Devosia sp. CN2-171 TaxID=3400909 RepID=UPI003BF7A025